MVGMKASVGELRGGHGSTSTSKSRIFQSMLELSCWLEENNYRGYDTFDGLNARFVRPLTFETKFLRTALLQGVRRFPFNLRPLLGVRKEHSSKGMGFLARGFLRLHEATGDDRWALKAKAALQWLIDHQIPGYNGACWGNHFDYQSRGFYLPKGVPTIVWTSLIGHAFLDGYERLKSEKYLEIAKSACHHILNDIDHYTEPVGTCISYVPGIDCRVHNANTLGASILGRIYSHTGDQACRELAEKAIFYTANLQRPDGSWYYGEKENMHWIDNFHTGYVLDCFMHYQCSTGDAQFKPVMDKGYDYWKRTFFQADGTPRYYNHKTLPIDIQCCSQAIETLVFFKEDDPGSLALASKIALWTIEHMQDRSGYFYYRRYSPSIVNRTPTLHWGQATMISALSSLYKAL